MTMRAADSAAARMERPVRFHLRAVEDLERVAGGIRERQQLQHAPLPGGRLVRQLEGDVVIAQRLLHGAELLGARHPQAGTDQEQVALLR